MTRTGKIARLPHLIRDQLNRRLHNGEKFKYLLRWLNSLPEVQAILAAEFSARPISQQNLTEWKLGGFRDWEAHQFALELAQSPTAGDPQMESLLAAPLTEKLAHWMALRYSASAKASARRHEDPQAEFRRLRQLCHDIVNLRRNDLAAGRLGLDQRRLLLKQAKLFKACHGDTPKPPNTNQNEPDQSETGSKNKNS